MAIEGPLTSRMRFFAWAYIIGGALGLLLSLPGLIGKDLNIFGSVAWLLLLSQLAAAVYGGLEVLKGRARGTQMLYWVSLSCVPLLECPLLNYYSAIGLGFLPNVTVGAGTSGFNLPVRFGYDSELYLFPGGASLTLGLNVVALFAASTLRKVLSESGIERWPLRGAQA